MFDEVGLRALDVTLEKDDDIHVTAMEDVAFVGSHDTGLVALLDDTAFVGCHGVEVISALDDAIFVGSQGIDVDVILEDAIFVGSQVIVNAGNVLDDSGFVGTTDVVERSKEDVVNEEVD